MTPLPGFEPARHQRYVERVAARTGCRYPLAPLPMPLSKALQEDLFRAVDLLLTALLSPQLAEARSRIPFFLTGPEPEVADLIGCADFHVQGDQARVIEVNVGPPGRLGLTEAIEEAYWATTGLDEALRINRGHEARLATAVTGGAAHQRVAVVVNPLSSSDALRPHYAYVARMLEAQGARAVVVTPDALGADGERPTAYGEPVDRIFNLVIVSIWRAHPRVFAPLTRIWERHPERFFPNPRVFPLGNKSLLAAVARSVQNPIDGLDEVQRSLLQRFLLPSAMLDEVSDVDALYHRVGSTELVVKPLDRYGSDGVCIRPGRAQLAALISAPACRMVAQPWFPSGAFPFVTPSGEPTRTAFSLRIGFCGGRAHTARAYAFNDPLEAGSLAPVLVIDPDGEVSR